MDQSCAVQDGKEIFQSKTFEATSGGVTHGSFAVNDLSLQ